jgi:two-component system sensor kinase Ihk
MVRKTFFFSALLIVLVTVISFAILYFAMPDYYLQKKRQSLQTNLDTLIGQLRQAAEQEEQAELIAAFLERNNATAVAFDAAGALIAELSSPLVSLAGGEDNVYIASYRASSPINKEDPSLYSFAIRAVPRPLDGLDTGPGGLDIGGFAAGPGGPQQRTFISRRDGLFGDVITLSGRVDTDTLGSITVSGTMQPIGEAKGVILSLMPYALLAAVILGLLLSWIYARQISKPILQISAAAERMQVMEPQAVSNIRSRDELGLLSQNLDALYASLCENIGQLQQEMAKVNRLERDKTELMQSASHELKTPIAALSGMLEGMIDNIGVYRDKEKYLHECLGQVEKLTALVAEILNASQAEGAQAGLPAFTETALDELVEHALADHAVLLESKELRLQTELLPVTISTEPAAFYRVLTNLIGNAARHTPPHGEIRLVLNQRHFSIENTCPPIPPQELSKLCEPFYTLSYSRGKAESGTGLGLYIVKRNLEMLNIPYTLENTKLGLKVQLTINDEQLTI